MCKIILPLRSHQSHNCYAILMMRLAQFKVQCGRIFCEFGICFLICTHTVRLKVKGRYNSCLRTAHLTLYFILIPMVKISPALCGTFRNESPVKMRRHNLCRFIWTTIDYTLITNFMH